MHEITKHQGYINTTALYSGRLSADTIILTEGFAWFHLVAPDK